MIYYGEEIGMLGQKGGAPAYDNYRREPMDWYADQGGDGQTTWFRPDDRWNVPDDGISVEEQEGDPNSLFSYYLNVLYLRMAHPALLEGDFEILEMETSGIGPWGFVRRADDEAILVIINFSSEEHEVVIGEFPFHAEQLVDLITGNQYPAPTLDSSYSLTLAPASVLYLSQTP
jgi:glycosidase